MAEKKGLLPCQKRCSTCLACIQIGEDGQERHTPDFQRGSGDPALAAKNYALRSYYGDY